MRKISTPFKPRARLLLELGNQLIKEEGIALFELVKNAYDADATTVTVTLKDIDKTDKGEIIVLDDGCGMDWDTIKNVWMEPGTDYRAEQVQKGQKTPYFHRTPMGQKGIGRFGAHKLGKKILLITRSTKQQEIVVGINWSDFEEKKYLEDVPVTVKEREPEMFTGKNTGTYIKITGLWNSWTRGMVRNIYRSTNSICSPFKSPDSFRTSIKIEDKDKDDWIKGLMSWKDAKDLKLFTATCIMEKDGLSYNYEFVPWKNMTRVKGRKVKVPDKNCKKIKMMNEKKEPVNLGDYNIGKVKLDLYIYDLDTNLLALGIKDKKGLREFLKYNGGLRVYRDGVRVYDYGEPGNDWLDLGVRRVNVPTQRISNNIMIGAASISRNESSDLVEKTNREGFIENKAVRQFREAVLCALTQIEAERNKDKKRLRATYTKTYKEPVIDAVTDLRTKIEKKGLTKELGGYLDRIENDYRNVRDKLLTSAGAGLSLSIVIHEIDKIIRELSLTIEKQKTPDKIKTLTKHLAELVEGYATLVRKGGSARLKASDLIRQAIFNVNYRLAVHNITVINGSSSKNDFVIKCSRRLILGAIMNLVDNSIWWLANKNPSKKIIYITPSKELSEGPAIVIADNGTGFMDTAEDVTQPFFSRKPDGMGLGLHITDEVMKAHKGFFRILEEGEIRLPKNINGAISALVFSGERK